MEAEGKKEREGERQREGFEIKKLSSINYTKCFKFKTRH